MKRWNYASLVLVLWSGLSLLLPAARAVGLIHLSWWICAAPFGLLFLLAGMVVVFAGLIGRGALIEAEHQRLRAKDAVASGLDDEPANELVRPPFLTSRFTSKQ